MSAAAAHQRRFGAPLIRDDLQLTAFAPNPTLQEMQS